ncbi:MAG: Malonate-semialdehyde dehydrogenase [inositol] [uncultured Chthoniobacterales bacterium]|uniref:methylmalonate-semialdehyde dehydrogenase (CoA acylating) n=1 Tax=uncultured Chthoniobacterales bacterium TaxID=1836801 RepID=A0A6J4I198_9BACT|nr:MAG: Malonate-semialdehyde dehydrogenase [inositol] [uncultured Chthoniobacterales bacterium]
MLRLDPCPIFVAGEWIDIHDVETSRVHNPSVGDVIAEAPMCTAEHVNAAVEAAAAAFPDWWETPPVERARILFRFKMLLEENFEEIVRCITREHGKTLVESRGDLRRGIEMVEFSCGIPSLLTGESIENIARGIDCDTIRQPLGVCVGITPFNFPAMVPLWMYPVALACGNTFVLKPSEKVPLTAMMIARLLEQAGIPPGVFNIVHGGREAVDALLTHPQVRAVSFVGSTPIARYIFETATRHGKRAQANGSAKNFALIMPDADVENSTRGVIEGAFGCAGERCMASSTAVVVGGAAKTVLPALADAARSIRVGRTDTESQPNMGPLITGEHRNRVAQLIEAGVGEGAKILNDGRGVKVDGAPNGFYLGATILDEVQNDMTVSREEIFGPVLNVMRMDDLGAAIEAINRSPYGNGASIFTRSGKAAREFKHRIKAGMVGINVGVPASMAWFPFNGWGDSFFGDLHMQGKEGVQFFTQQKVTTSRWFDDREGNIWSDK